MASQFTPEQLKLYRKHFEVYDLNGDGVISARELTKVSRKLGYRLSDKQIVDIMRARDLDNSGSLNFEEFLTAMPGNLVDIPEEEHRMAEIRRKFQDFDQDGNGQISAEEAHDILRRELQFTAEQSQSMVKKYDKNGDGQLSYEEFVRFYAKVRAKAETIKQMFQEYDKDGSGSISVGEAKVMLGRLNMATDEIENMIAMHDKNRDGELQYEEFVSFLLSE
jgi:Ca2+-binding EF-hand superfamily protein